MAWLLSLKISWAALSLLLFCVVSLVLWKARGILSWRKSLKAELQDLRRAAAEAPSPRQEAMQLLIDRCEEFLITPSVDLSAFNEFPQFIGSIAACYSPDAERPELQITLRAFLYGLETSLDRLDRITKRPGFRSLRRVRIRDIRLAYQKYRAVTQSRLYAWYDRHRETLGHLNRLRLVLLADIFSWLAFFSNHFLIVKLMRFLVVDFYLFFGKLAIHAYSEDSRSISKPQEEEIEPMLEELESLEDLEEAEEHSEIHEIRKRLVGFPAILFSNPKFSQLKNAVIEAAKVIAEKHFPASEKPLEEAALGPLVERVRSRLETISKGKHIPITSSFYDIRLYTFLYIKNLSDRWVPELVRNSLKYVKTIYQLVKWPLKVYRLIRQVSPVGIAVNAAWEISKKVSLVVLCGHIFDTACEDLETVYGNSR